MTAVSLSHNMDGILVGSCEEKEFVSRLDLHCATVMRIGIGRMHAVLRGWVKYGDSARFAKVAVEEYVFSEMEQDDAFLVLTAAIRGGSMETAWDERALAVDQVGSIRSLC